MKTTNKMETMVSILTIKVKTWWLKRIHCSRKSRKSFKTEVITKKWTKSVRAHRVSTNWWTAISSTRSLELICARLLPKCTLSTRMSTNQSTSMGRNMQLPNMVLCTTDQKQMTSRMISLVTLPRSLELQTSSQLTSRSQAEAARYRTLVAGIVQ